MDQEQESNANENGNKNVAKFVTEGLKESWRNFLEKFQQSFDLDQLDPVLFFLRESESTCQNQTNKKTKTQLMELKRESLAENSHDDDDENTTSLLEKKVFGNHLLAKSIFKCLSKSDLLSCRLTNSYWNEFATEILLERDLNIKFHRKMNRFYLWGSNWKSLDMFTELLRTSKQFPCNKFVFEGGNLGNDDAQRFFSFYGPSIKIMEIFLNDSDHVKDGAKSETGFAVSLTDSSVIGMILSQQLPNLEELDLDLTYDGDDEWSGHESLLFPPDEKVKLPKLKKLLYESDRLGDDYILRQLLVAATNLEYFRRDQGAFDVNDLDDFTETGKVKCIIDLSFPVEAEELEKVKELIKHEPKVADLSLGDIPRKYTQPESWMKISTVLAQFFECCKASLAQIFYLHSLGFLPKFQLAILENVTYLMLQVRHNSDSSFNVEDVHDYSFAFLPRGATFSRNFPRLKSVYLYFESEISSEDGAECWSKYFPIDQIVPTVKELDVGGHLCPLLWMEKLSKMFPNLQELSINDVKDFSIISKTIWTLYSKLKILHVGFDMSSPLNSYPALDSSFTGFSPEVCKQLGELSTTELESVAENYMENREPSLLDLADLRTLKIGFHSAVSNADYSKILTPLTGICVFRPLKNLEQVNIHYSNRGAKTVDNSRIKSDLELLKPYKGKITTFYD